MLYVSFKGLTVLQALKENLSYLKTYNQTLINELTELCLENDKLQEKITQIQNKIDTRNKIKSNFEEVLGKDSRSFTFLDNLSKLGLNNQLRCIEDSLVKNSELIEINYEERFHTGDQLAKVHREIRILSLPENKHLADTIIEED